MTNQIKFRSEYSYGFFRGYVWLPGKTGFEIVFSSAAPTAREEWERIKAKYTEQHSKASVC